MDSISKRKPDRLDAACEYFTSIGKGGGFCFDEEDGMKVKRIDSWQNKTPFTADEEKAVDAKLAELVASWDAEEYKLKRTGADGTTDTIYPDWGTQLDYIYHHGIDKWKTDIVDPVKKKYPKP